MESWFCTECGSQVDGAAKFCSACGMATEAAKVEPNLADVTPTNSVAPTHSQQGGQSNSTQPFQTTVSNHTTVIIASPKSAGMALILTILFGPLGMFYSTITGGVVMSLISIVVAIFTLGMGLIITWPICVIWAVVAANSHNSSITRMTSS